MVGVPMPEPESFSCSDPKVPDAQTRNSEAIKHMKRGGKWFFFDTAEAPSKPQVSFSDVSDATPHADDVR